MQDIRLAAVTLTPTYDDIQANLRAMREWSLRAIDAGATLIVFPEGFLTGYDLSTIRTMAVRRDSAEVEALAALAERHEVVISFGMLERAGEGVDEGFYVTQMYVGERMRLYHRKCHRTDWEKQHCVAGNTLDVQDLGVAKVGTLICYDSAFPAAAETLVRKGAEILIQPSCHGMWAKDVPPERRVEEIRKRKRHIEKYWAPRAYDHTCYAVYVNHAGTTSRGEWFPNYAAIIGPDGEIVADTLSEGEQMVVGDLSAKTLEQARAQRVGHYCTHADARSDLYWRA